MKHFFSITLLCVGAVFLMRCSLYYESPKKLNKIHSKKAPYDIIIVPGFPHEDGNWSQVVQMRMNWAKQLFEKGLTKNIMFSGGAVHSPYIESQVMKRYAIAMGIPKERIFTEENAKHSTENLYYSYVRAKELGFTKIALATDPFQNFNLNNFRIKYGIDIGLLPVVFKELKGMDAEHPEIEVADLLIENFVPLNEIENFGTRLQGTFGNQIRWREEDLPTKALIRKKRKKGLLIPKKTL